MKEVIVPTPCLTQEEIRNYLQSNSDDDTRYRVENHLLDCPLCSAAVEGFADYYNFEEHEELDELEETIRERYQLEENQVVRMPRRRPVFARFAAAAAVLLIGAAAIWYYLTPPMTSEQLFLSYYNPTDVPGLSQVRSASEAATTLQQAIELYRQEKYTKSQAVFEAILAEDPQQMTATLYAGLAALAAKDYAGAIDRFGETRQNSVDYWEDATWFLALTHLQQGNQAMTKVLLEELIQRDLPYYQERAITLLKAIER